MIATTWTRERVEDLLRKEQFRYQRIELPFGLWTQGSDRSATAKQIFPDDMTNKSVLDVGCSQGFFCFEAVKRGASRVVGLDVDPDVIRRNRLLADCLGMNVEFKVHDIEKQTLSHEFDYILCLNVLHHLHNPLTVLENLIAMTRERLILEMASFGSHDRRRMNLLPGHGQILSIGSVIYVNRNGTSGRHKHKRFFISKRAMRNMLQYHRHVFAAVDIAPSEHKGRYTVVAQKRKIENLIVVAGPTAVGKSTFCRLFLGGELEGHQVLDVDPPHQSYVFLSPRVSENPRDPVVENALFRYDILRPFMRSARVHSRDEALDVLAAARKVTFATLWCDPQTLRKRFLATRRRFKWPTKRDRRIREDYDDPLRIVQHYDRWFDFISTLKAQSIIVDWSGDGHQVLSQRDWNAKVGKLRGRAAEA